MEKILIQQSDVREFWPISKNISDEKVDTFILRAQQFDLEPVLGSPLYYAFIEGWSPSTQSEGNRWYDLMNGKSYDYDGDTIYFRGVRPLLACYAYSRFLKDNSNHVTRAGNVSKISDLSDSNSPSRNERLSREAFSAAKKYEYELLQFLDDDQNTTYPEYERKLSHKTDRRTGFRISKV